LKTITKLDIDNQSRRYYLNVVRVFMGCGGSYAHAISAKTGNVKR
jgi:hypothetical protein